MKRVFCFFSIVFAVFAVSGILLGTEFCKIAMCLVLVFGIAFTVLSKVYNKATFLTLSVSMLFALTALLLVCFIELPKLDEARGYDGEYIEAEGKIKRISYSDDYTVLSVKCDEGINQNVTLILRRNGNTDVDIGKRIEFSGELKFEDSLYNKGNECFLSTFPTSYRIADETDPVGNFVFTLRTKIRTIADGMENSQLVKAMMLADKSDIDDELNEDFKRLGTSHLLAISGLHLSIIVMSFYMLLTRLGIHHIFSAILSSMLALFYMLTTGFSLSLVRAGQMMMVFFLARSLRRANDSLTSLFISGFLILVHSPWSAFNMGFLMSFFATFGIIVFVPPIMEAYYKRLIDNREKGKKYSKKQIFIHKITAYLLSTSATTLSASTLTLPIVLLLYSEVSLFSVVGNLFSIAIAKYFLIFTFVSVVFSCIGLGIAVAPITFLSHLSGSAFIFITRALSSISPELIFVDTTFAFALTIAFIILIAVFVCFSRKIWSLPVLVVSSTLMIFAFTLISPLVYYNVALIDSVTKLGANTTLVRWRGEVYILDQTNSNSKKLYEIPELLENNGIDRVDRVYFINTKSELPLKRLEAMLDEFEIEAVTVVDINVNSKNEYEFKALCYENGIEYENSWEYNDKTVDGIAARTGYDGSTSFMIYNGDNVFCSYRSYTNFMDLTELFEADIIVFDGVECFTPIEPTEERSFRLKKH